MLTAMPSQPSEASLRSEVPEEVSQLFAEVDTKISEGDSMAAVTVLEEGLEKVSRRATELRPNVGWGFPTERSVLIAFWTAFFHK